MHAIASIFLLIPLAVGGPDQLLGPDSSDEGARPEVISAGFPITDPSWNPHGLGLPDPDAVPALNTATVLYVNFEGPLMQGGCGNDSRNDCSTIFGGAQFDPSPADPATRAAIIQATRADVVDFGVIVVGERPPEGNPYAMVVVGVPSSGAPAGVGGVAPGIDCGNNNPNITSFSFLVGSSANIQATVIHQEAAHTWGLEHIDDDRDNLFPTAGGTLDPKYRDECSAVVADTDLVPTNASCNSIHTMFCEANFQNSYQEMLALFGPPLLDTTPPTVSIDNPLDGQVLDYEEDFDLTITLDDDRRPQVMVTRIFLDGEEASGISLINATVTFGIPGGDAPSGHGWSNGEHTIHVDTEDESGNTASDEVTVTIMGNPDGGGEDGGVDDTGDGDSEGGAAGTEDDGTGDGTEDDGTGDGGAMDDDGGEDGCGCSTTPAPAPIALFGLVGLLGFRRRRRS
ncbi:MAG: MYXO-CTERM sorting domain-containing protein [Nannocystaceae bacterium]|nr:MYXO-CTERM sorting domain-containing protein [Nannocystaceae bacterium]